MREKQSDVTGGEGKSRRRRTLQLERKKTIIKILLGSIKKDPKPAHNMIVNDRYIKELETI